MRNPLALKLLVAIQLTGLSSVYGQVPVPRPGAGDGDLRPAQSLLARSDVFSTNAITPPTRVALFNGKDLAGWKTVSREQSAADATWTITNGVIHCSGKPTGYVRTEQSYRDYKLTVEWRFVRVAPRADNTGVLVHMQLPDNVWPPCVQVQGKHGNQGDLLLMSGAESKEHKGMDANTPVAKRGPSNEKPVGEWDTIEVECAGSDVKAWVNGKLMNEGTECTVSSGFIGFQSEGGEFEVRKVIVEPLKPGPHADELR